MGVTLCIIILFGARFKSFPNWFGEAFHRHMANHLSTYSDLTRIESIICGANAGLITRFVIAPLDLVKIRMQLNRSENFFYIARQIAQKEGLRAFWKGNSPAELLYVIYSAAQFSTLRFVNHTLLHLGIKNEQARQFVAGGIAGSTATFVSYPLDYMRTRTAANQELKSSLIPTIRNVWAKEGITGFYHGATATVISVFPYMSIFFGTYSYLRESSKFESMSMYVPAVFSAASVASVASKASIYPLDTIRKRVQVHGAKSFRDAGAAGFGQTYSHNVLKAGLQIVQREGFTGLYRGLPVSLLKAWPGSFVSMMVFEGSLNVIRRTNGGVLRA